MKAERRHELKSNTLATKLVTLPDTGKKFAGRFVFVLALVAVAVFLIVNRITTANNDKDQRGKDLALARALIDQLRQPPNPYFEGIAPAGIAGTAKEARDMVQTLIDTSTDKKLLAEAWVAKGDLAWILGNNYWKRDGSPMLDAATSQPAMRPKEDRETLLKEAGDAYREVLDKYQDEPLARISAQFGAAAIAENRGAVSQKAGDWNRATDLYQAILQDKDAPQAMKDQAKYRLDLLPQVRKPVVIGIAEKPLAPVTKPFDFGPLGPQLPPHLRPASTSLPAGAPLNGKPPTTQSSGAAEPHPAAPTTHPNAVISTPATRAAATTGTTR